MNLVPRGKASVLIDGQYGSTGKGLLAAFIASHNDAPIDLAVTNASANAGHTTVTEAGFSLVCYHLPSSMLVHGHTRAFLDAGAIIDPAVLEREINELNIDPSRVTVHPFAAIIEDRHRVAEKKDGSSATKIGSTQKGVGQALASKIMREGNVAVHSDALKKLGVNVKALDIKSILGHGARVLIEVPQGASLSLNSGGFYPYCTSREVSVSQALSDACVPPSVLGHVFMSLRTFPIRVGDITEIHQTAEGPKEIRVGHSGPSFPDQKELTWEQVGQPPEVTTVTKRVRRVFEFSMQQLRHAIAVNEPTHLFLNFCNYLVRNGNPQPLFDLVEKIEEAGPTVWAYGFGPKVSDVNCDLKMGLQAYMQRMAMESL
jgi:adenylosuccinate synthase